jgi:hypothetical protein
MVWDVFLPRLFPYRFRPRNRAISPAFVKTCSLTRESILPQDPIDGLTVLCGGRVTSENRQFHSQESAEIRSRQDAVQTICWVV